MQEQYAQLSRQVAASPTLVAGMKEDPVKTLETLAAAAPPLQTDVMIYRMVVGSLGLVLILAVVGSVMLSIWGKPIPEQLGMLGSAAVGALAGLLAPTPHA